ncbi:MAG: gliding motility-associated C-terminal domain-containing protein [Bacteroidales bacterium]|nr:gliding motility-associated C-terminal domain-containing protein [Bacteroidales bacterium]
MKANSHIIISKIIIIIFFGMLLNGKATSQKLAINKHKADWNSHNPFKTNVFIENIGQFNNWVVTGESVKYAVNNSSNIYFTQKGLIFKLEKAEKMSEKEREEMEGKESKGKEENKKRKTEIYHVYMQWEGSNSDAKIEVSDETENYYAFGEKGYENIRFKGYRKLTYKNLYPGIDVEYIIPEDKGGIKYSIILHPGSNAEIVKMHYTGDIEKIYEDAEGNIKIKTPVGEITDHTPKSFYKNSITNIESSFQLKENTVSFYLETRNPKLETIVLDPWTTTPTSLTTDNTAYDIDFDDNGNVYVAGGTPPFKICKYTNTGILLWTFTTPYGWNNYETYSKFCVIHKSGSIFLGEGAWVYPNPRIMKIPTSGTNSITSGNLPSNDEIWFMFYNSCTEQLLAFGGGTLNGDNLKIVDTNLTNCISKNFNGFCNSHGDFNDIADAVMENNGDFYALMSSYNCSKSNYIEKSLFSNNYNPPLAFDINTGYYFYELNNVIPGFVSLGITVRANALALNSSYLFSYDGKTLIAWDKTNGNLLSSLIVNGNYTGGANRTHEGIDVDECNNVYVGGKNKVHVFTFDAVSKTFITKASITTDISDEVYGIKMDRMTNILYVCGNGFVTVAQGLSCSIQQLNVTTTINKIDTCKIKAVITVNNGIPPYTYLWSNGARTSSIELDTGTYYVTVTDNSCMLNKHIDTVIIKCSLIIEPTNIEPIIEKDGFTVYIPNAFRPDGGILNNGFIPQGYNIDPSEFQMIILNRWGEEVYKTNDLNSPWNGRLQNTGSLVQVDVYVYRIIVKEIEGSKHEFIGRVSVIR